MRAHRRVDAARHVARVAPATHLGVQVVAHAVQALELETFARRRCAHALDRRDGVRVVRGELRVDRIGVPSSRLAQAR